MHFLLILASFFQMSNSYGPTSSISGASFRDPSDWDRINWSGPAVNLPEELLGLGLEPVYSVEFLPTGSTTETPNKKPGQTKKPRKNRVVVRFVLKTAVGPKNKYRGVRIAMELADKMVEVIDNHEVSGAVQLATFRS